MFIHRRQLDSRNLLRAGFTLVEMLVAVALVLLMMTMFAEIFRSATDAMSKQKALAELDQRQRLMVTLLRDDIKQRSFRNLFPYHQLDSTTNVTSTNHPINISFGDRLGYFYISENDPDNDADDILQFTVTRKNGTLFYGRTKELVDSSGQGAGTNPNQPENDDGAFFGDGLGVGTSPSAEVSFFLRNGTLYRRVSLIRLPTASTFSDQPSNSGGASLIQTGIYPQGTGMGGIIYVSGASATNRYPEDFDFSASYDFTGPQLKIFGQVALSNAPGSPPLGVSSLGVTKNRFGFQRPTGLPGYPIGLPLEYLPTNAFIGRFTHEETSHTAFAWPGDPGWGADSQIATNDDTNPYTRQAGLLLNPNGAVTLYAGGSRQGEDILMTRVQSFDVKVWDPSGGLGPDGGAGFAGIDDDNGDGDNDNTTGADDSAELGWPGSDDGAWVDIGHSGIGYFSQANNQNSNYGPLASNNRCFDTWHPDLGGTLGVAPFRPALVGADGAPGRAGIDDDNGDGDNDNTTGADDSAELGWPNSDDVPISIKAIQIRIRYLDLSSGLVREVTIVEQMTPDAI